MKIRAVLLMWSAVIPSACGSDGDSHASSSEFYDYVVVGCGRAGLVVSARLSERYDTNVLCLEAGDFDQGEEMITVPHYIGKQPPGFYTWQLKTVPQTQLDGGIRSVPVGKGVGGGSLVNGMLWNRGNQETYDVWEELGNLGWSWTDLLPYFRKVENFVPKTYLDQAVPGADIGTNTHGAFGPVQVTYPEYSWPQSNNWFNALESVGIPLVADPNEGLSAGGYFLPLNLFARTQTRHDARRAYYDPAENRTNLRVQPRSFVRQIKFDNSTRVRAVAVIYQDFSADNEVRIAYARKEIILAAGALHTPKILELSGIGQAGLLRALKIPVVLDLPGVGNNLQDHALIHLNYTYMASGLITPRSLEVNSSLNEQCKAAYYSSHSGPWTAAPLQAVAFPSLAQFAPDVITPYTSDNVSLKFLPHFYVNETRAGFELQTQLLLASLHNDTVPAIEVLHNGAGGLDLALQRPLSRGSVHIESPDPLVDSSLNPNWLSHPLDFEIMVEGLKLNQQLIETLALQALHPTYKTVPRNATPQQMAEVLRSGIGTEFHMSGTAAMMPQDLGGVVDTSLKVYGTDNLRIVDTSIFPLIPAAHLQAVTFAAAEKAADIIKGVVPGPAKP